MSQIPPQPPPLPVEGQPSIPPRPDVPQGHDGQESAYRSLPTADRWGLGRGDAHPKATWRWWEAILVFFLGLFLAGILGAVLAEATGMGEDARFFLFAIVGQVVPLAILVGWLQLFHRSWRAIVGWPTRIWPELRSGVLGGLAIYGLGALVLGTVLMVIFNALNGSPLQTPEQLPSDMGPVEIAVSAFMVVVGAPLVEEFFFRGIFFRSLRAAHSFWFAGALSSLLFGLAHLSVEEGSGWAGGLYLVTLMFFVGFGFAYLYERRGNILANIVAHATFNSIGLILIVLFS